MTVRPDPSWMADAACLGADAAMFFPGSGESQEAAKAVCRRCRCRQECLDYALALTITDGIWGGLSERERARLRRELPRSATCRCCGVVFEPANSSVRYCSDDCRDEGYAARHRLKQSRYRKVSAS